MAITSTLLFTAKPEEADNLYKLLSDILGDTRAFDGCHSVTAHRDLADPAQILLIELWDSKDHQMKYLGWRKETGDMDRLGALLAAAPVLGFYDNSPI